MTTANANAGAQGDTAAAGGAAATGAPGAAADAAAAAAAGAAAGGAAAGGGAAAAGGDAGGAAAAAGAGDGKGTQAGAEAPKPPDKYELAIPEGGPLDQADLDALAITAKAKGLTNEQAQAAAQEMSDALVAQGARFLTETNAHPEIGGERTAVAQQQARAVIDRFLPANTPEGKVLRLGLDKSGYGNWAPLVLLLARIGKQMAEDTPITPDSRSAAQKRDAASVLYGGGAAAS